MMRVATAMIALVGGGLALGAEAQVVTDEPSAAVKSCIAANASAVDRVFESLNEGADFLVLKVCAGEISDQLEKASAERSRKQREDRDAHRKEMCEDRKTDDTDAINNPASPQYFTAMLCAQPDYELFAGTTELFYDGMFPNGGGSPKATALAAKTLLDLRMKRLGQKP